MFYAAEPSLDLALLSHIACLALILFIVSCDQMIWLFVVLLPWLFGMCIFSTALALNVLSAEHVTAVPEGACGSYCLHVCPVWLLLHIPVISLAFSPSSSSCPALPVQEVTVSAGPGFSSMFLSLLWQVRSRLAKHQPLIFTFLLAWDISPLHTSGLEGMRETGPMLPKGCLGRGLALKAGMCMRLFFLYEGTGDPLGRGKKWGNP